MKKLNRVKVGDRVFWNDPEGITSDWYVVETINGFSTDDFVKAEIESDCFSWYDAIIGLTNGFSYVEAFVDELSK